MKKLLLFASITAMLMSCNKKSENEYTITGTVDGIENGKMVFLEKNDEMGLKAIDTVKVKDGKFKFVGNATEPKSHFIQVESIKGKVHFILENGDINVIVYKDSTFASKVSGTYNNDQLVEFNSVGKKIQEKMMAFQNQNQAVMQNAQQQNDTVTINKLRKEFGVFQKELQTQAETYMATHPKSYITLLLIGATINQADANVKEIEKSFNALSSDLKNTDEGKEIEKILKKLTDVEIGEMAPEFSGPNPEGKIVSLKESLGKVTIIDFWASWCNPCRVENPNIVALYNEFHSQGLNIIGVSLDKEEEAKKWKEAIEKDKLTWNQVSNLKFWEDPIALRYGIKSIPQMFILDATGKIVAKDLRGDALKAKVQELLAVK